MRSSIFLVLFILCLIEASCVQDRYSKIKLNLSHLRKSQFNYISHNQDTLILRPDNPGIPLLIDDATFSSLKKECPKINCSQNSDVETYGTYAIEAFTLEGNLSKLVVLEHGEAGLSKRYKYIVLATLTDQTFMSKSDIEIGMSRDYFLQKIHIDKPDILSNSHFQSVIIEDIWGLQLIQFYFNDTGILDKIEIGFKGITI